MRRLKVWFLADQYAGPNGGTEKQLLTLIRALCALDHDVRMFVLRHSEYSRVTDAFPCEIESLEVHSILSLRTLHHMWEFRGRILRERPDVVHAFFNDAAILGPLFCRTPHTAVLTSRRDMGFWHQWHTLIALRLANRRANLVICNAQAVAQQVQRHERLARSRLRVVYNGVEETSVQSPGGERRARATEVAAALATDGICICLLANIRRIKRLEDFIAAAARLQDAFPQSRFLIVGHPLDVRYQWELRALAERLNVAGRLHFTGAISEPLGVLRACHIGVLTSESEGLSNAILEYMRAGLPVVCSNTGGNPELVTHGHNGMLYDTGSVLQLTACLELLCRDPAQRSAMAAASRREAERYSVKAMTDSQLKIYSELRGEA